MGGQSLFGRNWGQVLASEQLLEQAWNRYQDLKNGPNDYCFKNLFYSSPVKFVCDPASSALTNQQVIVILQFLDSPYPYKSPPDYVNRRYYKASRGFLTWLCEEADSNFPNFYENRAAVNLLWSTTYDTQPTALE